MIYEYAIMDIGFAGQMTPTDKLINNMADAGWRLIAVVQRVGQSDCIRHYFEREKRS